LILAVGYVVINLFEGLVKNFLFCQLCVIQGCDDVDEEKMSDIIREHFSNRKAFDNNLAILSVQYAEKCTSHAQSLSACQQTGHLLLNSISHQFHFLKLLNTIRLAAYEISDNCLDNTQSSKSFVHQFLNYAFKLDKNSIS